MTMGRKNCDDGKMNDLNDINDFNAEDLPIIIFANWRGFSGGQRDMFLCLALLGVVLEMVVQGCCLAWRAGVGVCGGVGEWEGAFCLQ